MIDLPRFYHSSDDWDALVPRLKLIACPHCHAPGYLISHGFLRGYDDTAPRHPALRAHRVFCSNRHDRAGCGRTCSIWLADKLRRLGLTTHALARFLQRVVTDRLARALDTLPPHLSRRTGLRLWKRFRQAQCAIRTCLHHRGPPPPISRPSLHGPLAQVLAHLHAVFPDVPCPIAAFQFATNQFFL